MKCGVALENPNQGWKSSVASQSLVLKVLCNILISRISFECHFNKWVMSVQGQSVSFQPCLLFFWADTTISLFFSSAKMATVPNASGLASNTQRAQSTFIDA